MMHCDVSNQIECESLNECLLDSFTSRSGVAARDVFLKDESNSFRNGCLRKNHERDE